MEQFLQDLRSICKQHGHKVEAINCSTDSNGKITDLIIYMDEEDEGEENFLGGLLNPDSWEN